MHLVPVLLTFYIQGVLKLKKNNSCAKRLSLLVIFCKIHTAEHLTLLGGLYFDTPVIFKLLAVTQSVIPYVQMGFGRVL